MEPASKRLKEKLSEIEINKPKIPVIFNVTASAESDPETIRELLAMQLVSPVRWEESVKKAISMGANEFLEVGPKSVLASLVRKISQDVDVKTRTIK
jgi:[acyl-carrier-protein] S-malonyltransferase